MMRHIVGAILGGVVFATSPVFALAPPRITAPYAVLQDAQTGLVLYEKGADVVAPPASLTKLMTALLVFDALEEERVTMETRFRVSWRAWEAGAGVKGNSAMFLREGELVQVRDLLRGLLVTSGNDAAVALAEGLAGTQSAFAEQMNIRANALQMRDSYFVNASGLPDPAHRSSARDLAKLTATLITRYPQYYAFFRQIWFEWGNVMQRNRNDFLLETSSGIDGLKTGHTREAGYNIVLSGVYQASQDETKRRVILVLNGANTHTQRMREAYALMQWGYENFLFQRLADEDDVVVRVPVWQGAEALKLAPALPIYALLPQEASARFGAYVLYDAPLQAPIRKGTPIGRLVITETGLAAQSTILRAANDVERIGFPSRLQAGFGYLWQNYFGEKK